MRQTRSKAQKILQILKKTYPKAKCALNHKNPLELLVATILAAQCTDARVNGVTPPLFAKYPTAQDYALAQLSTLEKEIRSTGFYRQKAKSLKGVGRALCERFAGKVPKTMTELVSLPGVWRKTANVILSTAYGIPGIVVDTHVRRLSYRMGFTGHTNPDKIELDLMKLFLRRDWSYASHVLTFHGRQICTALRPNCPICPVQKLCPKRGVVHMRRVA